jgi:hypothetical protein
MLDKNGDSEGNYSVLALKPYKFSKQNFTCPFHLIPVGKFYQADYPVNTILMFAILI